MSTHPNAILLLALTPDNTARKTMRDIHEELGFEKDGGFSFSIAGRYFYGIEVMESDYDESNQIALPEGTLYLTTYLTYGYGETMKFADVIALKSGMEEWAKGICERHKCSYEFFVTANYW